LAIYRGVADLRANYDSSPLSDLHQVTKELSGA
jgi:hypothetical protein